MVFKPWQSWNPAWKPVWTRSIETLFRDAIKKIATDQSVKDVERDLVITLLTKAKKWDMRAIEMYLDRLYGKPKQNWKMEITWKDWSTLFPALTPEQLKNIGGEMIKLG